MPLYLSYFLQTHTRLCVSSYVARHPYVLHTCGCKSAEGQICFIICDIHPHFLLKVFQWSPDPPIWNHIHRLGRLDLQYEKINNGIDSTCLCPRLCALLHGSQGTAQYLHWKSGAVNVTVCSDIVLTFWLPSGGAGRYTCGRANRLSQCFWVTLVLKTGRIFALEFVNRTSAATFSKTPSIVLSCLSLGWF